MKPILFKIGDFSFPSYTFMIMVGVLAATWLAVQVFKKKGLPVIIALDLAILGIIFGFVGARIAHVLVEEPRYYLENPIRVFYFWQGGFVSWGAHLGVLLSWFFYLRAKAQSMWACLDLASLVMFVAIFFGRIGCLMTGCCFGLPTDFFFHLTFSNPESTAYAFYPNTPLHATQIYLMVNVLVVQLILWMVAWKRWRFQGQIFSLALMLYAVGRTLIEPLRGDVARGVYFGGLVSSAQLVMAGYFLVGLVLYFYFKRKALPPP